MSELLDSLRAYGERLTELVDDGAGASSRSAGSRGFHRVVLAAACFAILGALGALLATREDAAEVRPPAGEEEDPTEPASGLLAGTWTALPTALGNGDSEPALLLTDAGLINLHPENGGNDVAGELWAIGSEETEPFAPSGMVWRAFPSVAWTGTEVIIAGGSNGPGVAPLAVAYNPSTDAWRELPGPPGVEAGLSANEVTDGVWTGTELVSWNSRLAFDPSDESWRTISPSPLSERSWAAVAATDKEIFVWGGCSPRSDGQCDEVLGGDELTDGALYDPATDTWKPIAASPLGPGDHPTAVWTGTEVIVNVPAAVDPDTPNLAAYDPSTDTWRVLPDSPQPTGMYTQAAWTGRFYILHGGLSDGLSAGSTPSGATSVLDLEHERWYRLPDGPARGPHTMTAIGPTSVVIAGGYSDASPWLLDFDDPSEQTNRIRGELLDGRPFTVRHDAPHGLCLVINEVDFGCDDVGPVITPEDDPSTPRWAIDNEPPHEKVVAYGYLPPDAVEVVGTLPNGEQVTGTVIGGIPTMWALPLPPADEGMTKSSLTIHYVNKNGAETPAPEK